MTQVAGRAGRRDAAGEVVIQTTEPGHPVIRQVAAGDYEAMARTQLAERRAFAYPPYARLIRLTLRQRDRDLLYRASRRSPWRCAAVSADGPWGRSLRPSTASAGVHHRIPAQNRERRLGLPCPGSAARGAPADARCERVPNRNARCDVDPQ